MRHRVTIQKRKRLPDGQGGWKFVWVDEDTVWASMVPVSAKEKLEWQRLNVEVSHNVTIRYGAKISDREKQNYRLNFRGQILEIVGIINEHELNRILKITTIERVNLQV